MGKPDPQDLLRLAEAVEKATGPDRALDIAIAVAIGWSPPGVDARLFSDAATRTIYAHRVPRFTASLDAAETLVPEGDDVTGERYRLEAYFTNGILMPVHVRASAWVPGAPRAFAATPAMALCAADLKARAHSTKESDSHVK